MAAVEKIRFYPGEIRSRSRMHVTVGPATVMAELLFFGLPDGESVPPEQALASLAQRVGQLGVGQREQQQAGRQAEQQVEQQAEQWRQHAQEQGIEGSEGQRRAGGPGSERGFQLGRDYLYQEELHGLEGRPASTAASLAAAAGDTASGAGEQEPGVVPAPPPHYGPQWCHLRFSQPVTAPADSLVIGAKLDADINGSACRLAFYGRLCWVPVPAAAAACGRGQQQVPQQPQQPQQQRPAAQAPQQQQQQPDLLQRHLRIYKLKRRQGGIERVEADGCTAICRGMFQKETDLSLFTGERGLRWACASVCCWQAGLGSVCW